MSSKKLGRPIKGKEVRVSYSVRLEASTVEKIKQEYGSLTEFINQKIKRDKKLTKRLGAK